MLRFEHSAEYGTRRKMIWTEQNGNVLQQKETFCDIQKSTDRPGLLLSLSIFCRTNTAVQKPPWTLTSKYNPGVKLRGIKPDLRSGTSCLRSTTSNDRSGTSQLRSGTFLLGSTTLHSLYLVGGREPHVCFRPFHLFPATRWNITTIKVIIRVYRGVFR